MKKSGKNPERIGEANSLKMFERGKFSVDQLLELLLKGCSLRIVMEPDPSRKANTPHYWEMLDLACVVAGKDHFWGFTFPKHVPSIEASLEGVSCSFCYSSPWNIFASFAPPSTIHLMPGNLYRSFRWGMVPKWKILWDSSIHHPAETRQIAECIRQFKCLKILAFFEGLVFSIPVDIPAFHPETSLFTMKTANVVFPEMFIYPDEMCKLEAHLHLLTKRSEYSETNVALPLSCKSLSTFFVFSADGFVMGTFFEGVKKYDRLVIMGENDVLDPSSPYWKEACSL